MGLGLAIAKHLVELHGGTISVESPGVGHGASFRFTLPLALAQSDAISEHIAPRPPEALHPARQLEGLKILVVDDEEGARMLVETLLTKTGASVVVASSVAEALEAVRRSRPDVVLSDIGMPDQDGYDLIRQLRVLERDLGRTIHAAALTAYASLQDASKVLAAGYEMHLSKPITPDELIRAIVRLTEGDLSPGAGGGEREGGLPRVRAGDEAQPSL